MKREYFINEKIYFGMLNGAITEGDNPDPDTEVIHGTITGVFYTSRDKHYLITLDEKRIVDGYKGRWSTICVPEYAIRSKLDSMV